MAGETQVGNIVYQVQMDIAGLLQGQRQVNERLDRLDAGFNNTARSANNAERSFASLSKVASALAAAISVQQVAQYAEAWTVVNNKLANSVRANEDLAAVTQRVFDISQNTRAGLDATASLYARLERATRSYGTSVNDIARLTTIINQGFVVSGATAQEASNAVIQLSQGLASGALRGEEFNSVNEQGNRLIVALADSMGVTIGQLRSMAAQGKLTTDVVVNGLLKQGDAIGKEFAKTVATMGQAYTVATNNITKFVGENSSANSVIRIFNSAIVTLSENMDVVTNVIAAASVLVGSRFAGALFASASARAADMHAAIAQGKATAAAAAATAEAATVTVRKLALDREQALSNVAVAQTEYNLARGTLAEALALDALVAAKSIAIQRSAAYAEALLAEGAAASAATAAAAAATTTIGSLATGALALIGGPVGAAVIAGAALFYFYQKAQQARDESIAFADTLDSVIGKMKTMSQVQLAAEIDKATKSITDQKEAIDDTQGTIKANEDQQNKLRRTLSFLKEDSGAYRATLSVLSDVQKEHTQLLALEDRQQNKLSQTVSKVGIIRAQFNGTFAQGIELLKRDGHEAGVVAGVMGQLGEAIDIASRAKDNFNSNSLMLPRSEKADEYNKEIEQENELLAITDKRLRAVTKARLDNEAKGGNQNQINSAGELAGKNYDLQQAEASRGREVKAAAKAETQAEAAEKRRVKTLQDLSNEMAVAELNNKNLNREAAQLSAVQDLGSGASQAQIAAASEQAGKIFDIQQRMKDKKAAIDSDQVANAEKQRALDLSQLERQLAAGDISYEQSQKRRAEIAGEYASKIAEANANAVVTPQQENAAKVDPVQALANENARKLALIQQFETNKTITEQQGIALRNAANKQYEEQRTAAMWELWRNQSTGNEALAASFDALSGNASNALTGIVTGSMSANEALSSISSTVLNSLVNAFVQMGVEWVKSAVTGSAAQIAATSATTAASVAGTATTTAASTASAVATTAAWTPAAIVASIGSFGGAAAIGIGAVVAAMALSGGLAGKRKNGGPVSAGSMYQVGEGGMPEIYRASNGSQYMIPGDNGKVISNKDLSGGGGLVVNNIIHNSVPNAQVSSSARMNGNGTLTLETIVSDIDQGGQIGQAISRNYNTQRKANE
ncbi:tape measure protein [Biostraticola tofi]|uniref:Tape measure domain-containing protein n=1 Tax=Biostraticola tofi TaxID=466109 RepID=A0A4R3Z3I6_9GAMM|nr:tape measure protein [Biostraticola tofi]TCW00384.1 tape measure domain-containing protein [Biostraticola tofi]